MSARKYFAAVLVLCSAGCREDNLVPDPNQQPIAVARVIAENGESVDEQFDGGAGVRFAFDGTPVEITLDGSESSDPDGEVETYFWLSGTPVPPGGRGHLSTEVEVSLPDGGTMTEVTNAGGRFVPEGEEPGWPRDVEKPTVVLGEGVWTFVLYVEDDKGLRSEVDAITFTVGDPAPPPPPPGGDEAVMQCVENVIETVPDACKQCVCETSDECRAAADPSVCGEDCWGLLGCIGDFCPDYAMTMDISCLTTNCMEFLAGGGGGAMMIGACVTGCIEHCRD